MDALNLAVQVLLLAAVVWYSCETRGLRNIAQEQLEALHTPCLVIVAERRDYDDAVIEMDGVAGDMILASVGGNVALDGMQDKQIAAKLRIMPEKAARWRNRFLDGGLPALDKDTLGNWAAHRLVFAKMLRRSAQLTCLCLGTIA